MAIIHRPLFPGTGPDEKLHCRFPRMMDILRASGTPPLSEPEPATKSTTMKTILKTSFGLLGLLFGALAISSCAETGSSGSTHNMGNPKNQTPMSDQQMPGRN